MRRRAVLAAVGTVVGGLTMAPAGAAPPEPTLTDRCGATLAEQVPAEDPLSMPVPEPVVESLDICASWYLPVVDQDDRLVAVEFRTDVHGDVADLPPEANVTWDWFSEDGSCYHQAVVSLSEREGTEVFVRDQCDGVPPPPLVDFVYGYVAGPPVLPVPADGVQLDGSTVVLRLELGAVPERVREILAPGRVLTRPHTHTGVWQRDGAEPYLLDVDTASGGAQDVPLP